MSTAGSHATTVANCSLVSPCRSFGSALTVTATDGEIVVLDSGGYGRVTIGKSVAIIAPSGVYAGISVFLGDNGIEVAGAGIFVALRGLTVNGQGGATGILFTQGSRLHIEQCTVSNLGLNGIALLAGDTFIEDTTVRDNSGYGIWAEGDIDVVIDRSRIEKNGNTGVRVLNGPRLTVTNSVVTANLGFGGFRVDGDDGLSETVLSVSESSISQNSGQGVIASAPASGSIVRLSLVRNTINRNSATGVFMFATSGTLTAVVTDNAIVRNGGQGGVYPSGAGVSATIAANAISGNAPNGVVQVSSALLKTRDNNIVQDNATNVSGTLTFVSGD